MNDAGSLSETTPNEKRVAAFSRDLDIEVINRSPYAPQLQDMQQDPRRAGIANKLIKSVAVGTLQIADSANMKKAPEILDIGLSATNIFMKIFFGPDLVGLEEVSAPYMREIIASASTQFMQLEDVYRIKPTDALEMGISFGGRLNTALRGLKFDVQGNTDPDIFGKRIYTVAPLNPAYAEMLRRMRK